MKIKIVLYIFFCLVPSLGKSQSLRIDHVVAVYSDLTKAIARYESNGFKIKQGRLHSNGLINAHIKFKNNTALELMSLTKDASGPIPNAYRRFLSTQEGGTYLVLTGWPIKKLAIELKKQSINFSTTLGPNWNYLVFEKGSGLEHVFFIEYLKPIYDKLEYFQHKNAADGFLEVVIDGDERLHVLFKLLQLEQLNDGVWATPTGRIKVVAGKDENTTFRVRKILFDAETNKKMVEW